MTPTNSSRADYAESAVGAFRIDCKGDKEDAIADLICNLLHLAKRQGMEPLAELRRGLNHYVCESFDDDGMSHEAAVTITVSARRYGEYGGWKPWPIKPRKAKRKVKR